MDTKYTRNLRANLARNLSAATAISLAVMFAGAARSEAATHGSMVNSSAFVDRLTSSDLAKWRALAPTQQRAALTLLADPRVQRGFATAGQAKAVSRAIDLVESHDTARTAAPAVLRAATATYEVHSWYSRTWTIFGIAYTTTQLDYYYVTGAGVVLYDHYCSASYSNRVPLRSMSVQVNHFVGGGKGTCVATWTLTKLNFWTDTSDQGMRVNGRGVEATWGP